MPSTQTTKNEVDGKSRRIKSDTRNLIEKHFLNTNSSHSPFTNTLSLRHRRHILALVPARPCHFCRLIIIRISTFSSVPSISSPFRSSTFLQRTRISSSQLTVSTSRTIREILIANHHLRFNFSEEMCRESHDSLEQLTAS